MAKTVFILGAGASVHAGAPVMRDFLDRAEELLLSGMVEQHRQDFDAVFKGIHRLQAIYAKSFIDLRNLEAVFVAFEMGKLLGRLPGRTKEVDALPDSLRNVIVTTLEESIRFPVSNRGKIYPPDAYEQFGKFIVQERAAHLNRPDLYPSIITFNYDCALDYALAFSGLEIDYGINDAKQPGRIELLKLHGSMHWIRSNNEICCEDIQVMSIPDGISEPRKTKISFTQQAMKSANIPKGSAFIVPPTASKADHHWQIRNVWQRAADSLSEAEVLVVAGYSLPGTDDFFRYLFALGTASKTRLKAVLVCNPDNSPELDARFRSLLGPMAQERYLLVDWNFQTMANKLGDSIEAFLRGAESYCQSRDQSFAASIQNKLDELARRR